MKSIVFMVLLVSMNAFADPVGEAAAIKAINATAPVIKIALEETEALKNEIQKTVDMERRILKAEINRSLLLTAKVYWAMKIKQNISRAIDADEIGVLIGTANNKIWIYNTSFSLQYLKDGENK